MNRYVPKPYRCNICLRSFDTEKQAERHWRDYHEGKVIQFYALAKGPG